MVMMKMSMKTMLVIAMTSFMVVIVRSMVGTIRVFRMMMMMITGAPVLIRRMLLVMALFCKHDVPTTHSGTMAWVWRSR